MHLFLSFQALVVFAGSVLCVPAPQQETAKVNSTNAAEEYFYDYGNYDEKQEPKKKVFLIQTNSVQLDHRENRQFN